jgi:hypothetical protein
MASLGAASSCPSRRSVGIGILLLRHQAKPAATLTVPTRRISGAAPARCSLTQAHGGGDASASRRRRIAPNAGDFGLETDGLAAVMNVLWRHPIPYPPVQRPQLSAFILRLQSLQA